MAGVAALKHMFSDGPYGMGKMPSVKHGMGIPKPPKMGKSKGGAMPIGLDHHALHLGVKIDSRSDVVPVVVSGGEYILTPSECKRIGNGDLKRGHEILDAWVMANRKKEIKTLKNLPGPATR